MASWKAEAAGKRCSILHESQGEFFQGHSILGSYLELERGYEV